MFTLSGEVFSVNKTSQFTLRLGKRVKAVLSSDQSWLLCRYHRVALTLQLLSRSSASFLLFFFYIWLTPITWYLVGVTTDLSDGGTVTDVALCPLCSGDDPVSSSNPARRPMYHNCLNTSCCTAGTPELGRMEKGEALSQVIRWWHGEQTTAQRGKEQ